MKVLVACEESQAVCNAFRDLGHEAYSADLKECTGDHPEWHIVGDCIPLLDGNCTFITQGGDMGSDHRKVGFADCAPAVYVSHPYGEQVVQR